MVRRRLIILQNKFICIKIALVCFCAFSVFGQDNCKPGEKPSFPGLASGFTENKGQVADIAGHPVKEVLFSFFARGMEVYITGKGLTYKYKKYLPPTEREDCISENKKGNYNWCAAKMTLSKARIENKNVIAEQPVPGYSNYYYGHCPKGVTHVLTYRKITIKNIYPCIDWVLKTNEKGEFEYDFIIGKGGNPNDIQMRYEGENNIRISDKADSLEIKTPLGNLREGRLVAFQPYSGEEISLTYLVQNNCVQYNTGKYNLQETLIIDPPLAWDVTYGGANPEVAYAAAAAQDASSDMLAAGEADGTGYPTTAPAQAVFGGGVTPADGFVARFKNATGARVYSTYIGGNKDDGATGISSDNAGNAYVTGYTGGGTFPKTLVPAYGGGTNDCWVAKFSAGGAVAWAGFYGGTLNDYAYALTTDPATGNSYITGYTTTNTAGFFTGGFGGVNDAFIMKLNNAGTKQYAIRYGGNDDDKGRAVAFSGASVYITGSTYSTNLPTTAGVIKTAAISDPFLTASGDAFILKVDEPTGTVQFLTYFGGNGADDFGQGIAVDGAGNVYVTGYTFSSSFPAVNPGAPAYCVSVQPSPGIHDAFLFECNGTATSEIWGTYLGGAAVDIGYAITLDASNTVYVTGSSGSTNFPVLAPTDLVYYQAAEGDAGASSDAFIAWFAANKQMKWSTYYGGAGLDEGRGIALDASNDIYVAGQKAGDVMPLKFTAQVVLPVELVGFTGDAEEKRNHLNWTTLSEDNNRFFTVERSRDGSQFEPLSELKGSGTSNMKHDYSSFDEEPLPGINYYRLRQTDFNGNFKFSSIISIDRGSRKASPVLFPNPVSDIFNCSFSWDVAGEGKIEIIDGYGKVVMQKNIILETGINFQKQDVQMLPAGIYILCIKSPLKEIRIQFSKQ